MQDLRDAVRALRSSPLLSTAAILSLTLGIGANTAIFSILNSLLLKPLPVRDPQTLVALASNRVGEDAAMTYPVWREIRDRRVLNDSFVWATDRVTSVVGGDSQSLETIWASGRFFDVLGLSMNAGRGLSEVDDRRGGGTAGPVAVLSYKAANRLFGTPAASIGGTITLERIPFTVVGVTGRGFNGLNVGSDVDLVVPLETEPMLNRIPPRTTRWPWLHVTGRLAPGMTLDGTTAAMRAAQPGIREATLPDFSRAEDRDNYLREPWTMRSAATGSSRLRSRYQSALVTLLAISGLVLLVACVNIAHLQLARTASRRYEFGVRLALGAPRGRIARLELIGSLLLAAIGAVIGLALARWAGTVVVAQLSTWASTAVLDLTPDWRVLGVTTVVTVATTVLFGTVPAIRAARVHPVEALNTSRRGVSTSGLATSMATPLGSAGIRFLRDVHQSGNPTFEGKEVLVLMAPVSPDWFRTFGTRFISGRDIEISDRVTSPKVAVVNEAFARRHFPGSNPVGQSIMVGEEPTDRQPVEIVGVVQDAAFTSVRDPIEPTFYMAFAQSLEPTLIESFPSMSLSIRPAAEIPPERLATTIATAIGRIDGAATVSFQTLTETLSVYYIRERLLALLSGYFGLFALLLGAIGVYGVTAHAVNRRRMEIGIRMAIGATAPAVVRLVVGRVAVLAALGVLLGFVLSLWGSRLIQALLFNTEFRDPSVLATSIVALLLVTALAAWMPARRASRIEPATVLREG